MLQKFTVFKKTNTWMLRQSYISKMWRVIKSYLWYMQKSEINNKCNYEWSYECVETDLDFLVTVTSMDINFSVILLRYELFISLFPHCPAINTSRSVTCIYDGSLLYKFSVSRTANFVQNMLDGVDYLGYGLLWGI